jgi:hypothetical protein
MSDDQRRDPRIATRQRLWREGQDDSVETRDVSRNGMFIVADEAPAVGTQLKLTLKDDGGEVTITTEVMWQGTKTEDNKTGVGVRIVGFDKGRDVYERFLSRHLRPSSAPHGSARPTKRPSMPAGDSVPTKR